MVRFKEDGKVWHLDVHPDDIGEYVFLPGDPFRTDKIAEYLTDAKLIAHNREHKTWTGYLGDTKVSVVSTGMGGPSAAIAVEELIGCGAKTLIRIGTAGRVSDESAKDCWNGAILTGAVRHEGTTVQYVPIEYPAIANIEVVQSLKEAAQELNGNYIVGVGHTKDSFYGQHEPDSMPVGYELKNKWEAWRKANVVCSEMEAAALFVVSAIRGVRAGAIMSFNDIDLAIRVACKAVENLSKKD